MATLTLNYEPMVFNPRNGEEAPLSAIQQEVLALKEGAQRRHPRPQLSGG